MSREPERLLRALLVEMVQTEQSARKHPRREAARIEPGAPPGEAMLAVAHHADRALPELERLCEGWQRRLGRMFGNLLSVVREYLIDRIVSHEKSYRGTLAGMHHGIDCATLTQAVAERCGRADVAEVCRRWLAERRPIVEECVRQLVWFASRPALARVRATAEPAEPADPVRVR
jgi:hypothetical protein